MESILLDIANGVATLTLNRPDVHNAFDEDVIAGLTRHMAGMSARADVQVVVLKGAGKSFSAGADLNWMKRAAGYTEAQNKDDALALARMLNAIYACPKLTIACVQGAAMGGGMGLVSVCDIVLATINSKFALSEVKLGLIPATIAPYVLRAIGLRHARRYFQTGERISAQKAYDINLVHELCADEGDMAVRLDGILAGAAANGPRAMAASKALCLDLDGRDIDAALMDATATRIAQTRAGDEAREGLTAFLEKRKAAWVRE